MTAWQPTLDGLTPPTGDPGTLTKAAVATVSALERDGLLEPRHALTVQLVLSLAESIGRGMASGKITVAMSQATRQLLDAIATLPTPEAAASDEWNELLEKFAEADARARAEAGQARA